LALFHSNWDLWPNDVLNANDGDKGIPSKFNIIEALSLSDDIVVGAALVFLKIFVGEGDCSQGLGGIESDRV
jgi:hypothetical protein